MENESHDKNKLKKMSSATFIREAGQDVIMMHDESGGLLQKIILPFRIDFHLRDMVQVIVGGSLLALPISFTEEIWRLGELLPLLNILGIAFLSILFISIFSYHQYYRDCLKTHWFEFMKRVIFTYFCTLLLVGFILTLIERAPWQTDLILAIKRVVLVAFPASLSATVVDTLR